LPQELLACAKNQKNHALATRGEGAYNKMKKFGQKRGAKAVSLYVVVDRKTSRLQIPRRLTTRAIVSRRLRYYFEVEK